MHQQFEKSIFWSPSPAWPKDYWKEDVKKQNNPPYNYILKCTATMNFELYRIKKIWSSRPEETYFPEDFSPTIFPFFPGQERSGQQYTWHCPAVQGPVASFWGHNPSHSSPHQHFAQIHYKPKLSMRPLCLCQIRLIKCFR